MNIRHDGYVPMNERQTRHIGKLLCSLVFKRHTARPFLYWYATIDVNERPRYLWIINHFNPSGAGRCVLLLAVGVAALDLSG